LSELDRLGCASEAGPVSRRSPLGGRPKPRSRNARMDGSLPEQAVRIVTIPSVPSWPAGKSEVGEKMVEDRLRPTAARRWQKQRATVAFRVPEFMADRVASDTDQS
jgi:hypothetical protein